MGFQLIIKVFIIVSFFFGTLSLVLIHVHVFLFMYTTGPIASTPYCEVELNDEKLKAFTYAVKNHYWYQMYLDDLPIWGVVGEITQDASNAYEYFIFTHKKFEIGYNGKQIVDVNLTSENKVKLEPGAVISFTYEVSWKSSSVKFEDRFDKYLDANFFQHRV